MATTPSIKVVKTMTYRGVLRRWSNRYHFNGGTPADIAHWTTFSDAVVAAEKAIFKAGDGEIVETLGYAAGSEVPVFSKTYATAYTGAFTSPEETPGDCAALIRYSTTARTAKNHPIYLFNYYHSACRTTGLGRDDLNADQRTAMETYAAAWIAGFSDGTNTLVRSGPNGATAVGSFVQNYITHRDFPRD